MSKTLFNTNTFQSKNVRNSDDVGTLKVDTFKATNAILTNITNSELQAATAGVATNASAIATNASAISSNTTAIGNNASAISSNTTAIGNNATAIGNNTTAIGNNTTAISNNAQAISGKQDTLTTDEGIDITNNVISFDGTLTQDVTTSGNIRGNSLEYVDSGVVIDVKNKINQKQDTLTEGTGIDITNNTVTFDGTSVSGNITTTGTITGNVMNYVDGGVVTNIKDEIESKQDTLTDANNAGTGISISGSGVISATGGTYAAATNGGLALSGSNEFSIDFSNTNATIDLPQSVHIEVNGTPQLLIEPSSTTGNDAEIEIRGARNGSESSRNARVAFTNYDNDSGGFVNNLGSIHGKVSNASSNIGGMVFDSYSDGDTRNGTMTISANGNVWIGANSQFQDFNKFQVTGQTYINGDFTAQTITTNTTGNSTIALEVEDGMLLCGGGTGRGATAGNGVIQIQCQNDGKMREGICMRASGNNDNCINFRNTSDGARGRIDGNGSSRVVYRTSSDVRLKENIEDMDSCWDILKNARPVKFRWIEDQSNDVGFIAQEVYRVEGLEALKPTHEDKYSCCDNSLNTFEEDGYCEYPMESENNMYPHALDYGLFTPYLWKALQEAITKIETLETKVADLEAQLIV